MVLVLPTEFAAPNKLEEEEEDEYESEYAISCLVVDAEKAVFGKPSANGYRHLKPLYVKGYV